MRRTERTKWFGLLVCCVLLGSAAGSASATEATVRINGVALQPGTGYVFPLSAEQYSVTAQNDSEVVLKVFDGLAYDLVLIEKRSTGTVTADLPSQDAANYRVETTVSQTAEKTSNIVDITELPDLKYLTLGGMPIPLANPVAASYGWYEGSSLVCLYEFSAAFPLQIEGETVHIACNFAIEQDSETGNILSGSVALDTGTVPVASLGQLTIRVTDLHVTVGQDAEITEGNAAIKVEPFTFGPYSKGIVKDITIAGNGGELAYDIAKKRFSTDSQIAATGSAHIGNVALNIAVNGLTASLGVNAKDYSYSNSNFNVALKDTFANGSFSLINKKPVINNFEFNTSLSAALMVQKQQMALFTSNVNINDVEGGNFNMSATMEEGKSVTRGRVQFVVTEAAEATAVAHFLADDNSIELQKLTGTMQARLLGVKDSQILATADMSLSAQGATAKFTAVNEPVFDTENFSIKVKKAYGGASVNWSKGDPFTLDDAGVDFTMNIAKAVDVVINGLLQCSADYSSNTGEISVLVESGIDFTFNPGKNKQTLLSLSDICGKVESDGNWKNLGVYLSGKLSLGTNALNSTLEIADNGIVLKNGKLVKFESTSDFYLETSGFLFKANGIAFDTKAKSFSVDALLEVDNIGYVATAVRLEHKGLAIDDISFEVDHGLVKASCNGATYSKGTFKIDNLLLTIRKPAGEGVFCNAKMTMLFSQSGNGKASYRYAYFNGELEAGAGVPLFNTGLMWTGGEVMAGYNTTTRGVPSRGSHAMGISGILRPVAASYIRILGGLELAYQPGSKLRTTIKGEVEVDFNNVVKAKGGLEAGYTWGYKQLDAAITAGVKVPSNGSLLNIDESRIDYSLCKDLPGGWTLSGRSSGTVLPKGFGIGFSGDFNYNGDNNGNMSGSFWAEANKANTPNVWDYQSTKRILFWKAKLQARYWYEANLRGEGQMQFASKKLQGEMYLGGSANAGAQAQAWFAGERIGPISAQASADVTGSNSGKARFAYYNNKLDVDGKIKTGINFSILGIRKRFTKEFDLN